MENTVSVPSGTVVVTVVVAVVPKLAVVAVVAVLVVVLDPESSFH